MGFEPPLNAGPVEVKRNRALPFKARLFDANGAPVIGSDLGTTPPVIQVYFDAGAGQAIDVTDDAVPVGLGTPGNQFVYTAEGNWQFNLSTRNYTAPGTYTVSLAPGNSYFVTPTCTASFVVR